MLCTSPVCCAVGVGRHSLSAHMTHLPVSSHSSTSHHTTPPTDTTCTRTISRCLLLQLHSMLQGHVCVHCTNVISTSSRVVDTGHAMPWCNFAAAGFLDDGMRSLRSTRTAAVVSSRRPVAPLRVFPHVESQQLTSHSALCLSVCLSASLAPLSVSLIQRPSHRIDPPPTCTAHDITHRSARHVGCCRAAAALLPRCCRAVATLRTLLLLLPRCVLGRPHTQAVFPPTDPSSAGIASADSPWTQKHRPQVDNPLLLVVEHPSPPCTSTRSQDIELTPLLRCRRLRPSAACPASSAPLLPLSLSLHLRFHLCLFVCIPLHPPAAAAVSR